MKSKILTLSFLLILIIIGCGPSQNPKDWTNAQVSKWFAQKEWTHGKLTPDSSINKKELAIYYHLHPKRWDTAFSFLSRPDLLSVTNGKHELKGEEVYAAVSEYKGRDPDTSHFEEHKAYADIQYVVSGVEYIERADTTNARVVEPYNPQKDIMYLDAESYSKMLATPGTFFIFFPDDAHKPSLRVNDSLVKKIVVKVKLD